MGKIKSALEIALERTESVKSDKDSIALFQAKQKGKKLANEFIDGEIDSLENEIKKEPQSVQGSLKQGVFDVLLSRIALPVVKDDLKRIERASAALAQIVAAKSFGEIAKQFTQFMSQYLDEAAHYEEAVKQQYAPKLRQKEEELSRRLGRQLTIDPLQDPEFVALLSQHISALKENYQAVADQVKQEAQRLFNAPEKA
ncbi:MAG: hypothetical protein FWD91_02515 [Treponema sp.]|nr:hypothetical protein [Treponema sp.]